MRLVRFIFIHTFKNEYCYPTESSLYSFVYEIFSYYIVYHKSLKKWKSYHCKIKQLPPFWILLLTWPNLVSRAFSFSLKCLWRKIRDLFYDAAFKMLKSNLNLSFTVNWLPYLIFQTCFMTSKMIQFCWNDCSDWAEVNVKGTALTSQRVLVVLKTWKCWEWRCLQNEVGCWEYFWDYKLFILFVFH